MFNINSESSNSFILPITCLVISLGVPAPGMAEQDVEGAKDHPLIERYPGSHIIQHTYTEYDEYDFVTAAGDKDDYYKKVPSTQYTGQNTTNIYFLPQPSLPTLKVFKSFQDSLRQAGAEIVFECAAEKCGYFFMRALLAESKRKQNYSALDEWNNYYNNDYRFLSAKFSKEGRDIYLMLTVALDRFGHGVYIAQDILEPDELKTEKLTVTLENLTDKIAAQGKVVLDGIYFEHDKAVITADSTTALNTIADYLTKHADKHFFVVGHTDSTGDYRYNIKLSQDRANAVVNWLTANKAIKNKQLTAVGIGPVAPNSSNQHEAGKKTNRRVELVLGSAAGP